MNDRAKNVIGRRLVPALTIGILAALLPLAAAGELATLHRILAGDVASGPAQAEPCKAPAGVACAPGGRGPMREQPVPAVSRLGVEMTPCYLGCPAFTAIFSADGTFTYVGEMNVEHMGEHTGTVDVATLRQVMRLAEELDFAALDDTYASSFLDNPSYYVMVETPDDTKVVRADGAVEPVSFWAIRQLLIGLLDDAEWDQ